MKQTGLKHRFDPQDRYAWEFWYECLVCGANGWDALHHIISPSTRFYKDLECNKSILNSCPIHNYTPDQIKARLGLPADCHIGNESFLNTDKIVRQLLERTRHILVDYLGYVLKPIDLEFLQAYNMLYHE